MPAHKTAAPLSGLIILSIIAFISSALIASGGFQSRSKISHPLVVRAYFDSREQIDLLARWTEPWEVNYSEGYVVISVFPEQLSNLEEMGFRIEVDQQLTQLLGQPTEKLPGQSTGIPEYPCYRTLEESIASAHQLVNNYPELASIVDIGDTWDKLAEGGSDGYDLLVLRLTNQSISHNKPVLFLTASIHPREYAPAELSLRFAEYLLQRYNADADITWLLDFAEIHILFQANPDGRKHAENKLGWRKNTNQNYCSPTSNYRGADLNRNFSFQWNCCLGSSPEGCDETYHGPYAASEPETQGIENYMRAIFPDQRGDDLTDPVPDDAMGVYLDLHSYSQLVLWPWGFTADEPPNGTALRTLGRKLAFFNGYSPQQAYDLYLTDGTTIDFAYGELGIATYTFELGTSFFEPCTNFENTILDANIPALLYAAKTSRLPYQLPKGPEIYNVRLTPSHTLPGNPIILNATADDTRYNNSSGIEATQPISAAQAFLDLPYWITATIPISYTLSATDGIFDNPFENVTVSIDTTGLEPGRHIIYLRAQDADGNWGTASAVFLFIGWDFYLPIISR